MNLAEHLLTQLMEECAEIQQRASKALRFGLHERQPGQEKTNGERIMSELDDLMGVLECLAEADIFKYEADSFMIDAKKVKIRKYLLYAQKECGTLKE